MAKPKAFLRLSVRQKRKIQGTAFLAPVIIGLVFIFIPAMALSFRMSLSDIKLLGGKGYELVSNHLYNYQFALTKDPQYTTMLANTVFRYDAVWVQVLANIVLSLFLAVILNQNFKGRTAARVILFLPVVLYTGLVNNIDAVVAQGYAVAAIGPLDVGTVSGFDFMKLQDMLNSIEFMSGMVDTLIGLVNSLYKIVISSGVQILVFLAGLQSISPSLYEAGKVDGITAWQSFWKITIPMISPLILVNVVYSIIAYLTDEGNPGMRYIGNIMSNVKTFPLSSAYSWIYFALIGLFVAAVMLVSRKLVFYNS